jgi:hypothetical protein
MPEVEVEAATMLARPTAASLEELLEGEAAARALEEGVALAAHTALRVIRVVAVVEPGSQFW